MHENLTDLSIKNLDLLVYKNAFLQSTDLAYLLDKNGVLIDCNERLAALLHLAENKEKNLPIYNLMKKAGEWSDNKIQTFKAKDIETMLAGEPSLDQTEQSVQIIKQKTITKYYNFSRIPLKDKENQVIALFVIIKDLTQEKIREDQFEKIKTELAKFNATPTQPIADHARINLPEKQLKILLVEDNAIAQKAAQALLMQLDCIVDVIKTEDELAKVFEPGKYGLVLMDIQLERTTGYIFAKKIRQQENASSHHVPIIALTGFNAGNLNADCAYADIQGAITKPLTLEQARQLIQHYVLHIDLPVNGLRPTIS